jgi:hypothetical protein
MIGAGLAIFIMTIPGSEENGGFFIPDVEHLIEILEIDLIL